MRRNMRRNMRGRENWGCVPAALCSMVGDGRKPGGWGRRCYKQMRLQKCWHVCLSLGASWVMKVTMPARCLNHHRITGRPWCQPGQMSRDLLYLQLHFNNVFLSHFSIFFAWYNESLTWLTRQNVPQITGFISHIKLVSRVKGWLLFMSCSDQLRKLQTGAFQDGCAWFHTWNLSDPAALQG